MALRVVSAKPVQILKSGKVKRVRNGRDPLEAALMYSPAAPFLAAADAMSPTPRKRKAAKKRKAVKRRSNAKLRPFDFWTDGVDQPRIWAASIEQAARAAAKKIPKRAWEDGARGWVRDPEDGDQMKVPPRYKVRNATKKTRFQKCVESVQARGGAYSARGVCAAAGRKKYGAGKFAAMAKAGKKRAAKKRGARKNTKGRRR